MQFTRSLVAAAASLFVATGASAQTTEIFDLTTSDPFANAYTFTVTGPSTVVGNTNSTGVTWWSVLLSSATPFYSAFDSNPDDGFSFTGLAAGSYSLTFQGSGAGGYGGFYEVSAVPEPETYAMFLAGLGALGLMASRRRNQA